ncbi:dienelactone hydrolase family protein [Rhodoferax sp. WC2427]|uniref:dienelactone hydrolase family protein n=1 Tax=Rhodoferax sp. WC2427 TaxID=3234144 RepID=UPI003465A81E
MKKINIWIRGLAAQSMLLASVVVSAAPLADLAGGETGRIEYQSMTPKGRWDYARKIMKSTKQQIVWGDLLMPKDVAGKTPAVIFSHDSGGPSNTVREVWAPALTEAGYAVFIQDSFGPRGVNNTGSDSTLVPTSAQVADTMNALRMLSTHPKIDATRIYNMGSSRGGTVAFETAWPTWQDPVDTKGVRFAGHIVLYPGMCNYRYRTDDRDKATAPILMLLSDPELDDSQDMSLCAKYADDLAKHGNDIQYKIYKGGYHGFDLLRTFFYRPDSVGAKDCDMEIFMTMKDGGGLGNAFDFRKNRAITSSAELVEAERCVKNSTQRMGGDAKLRKQAVADVLDFLKHH